MTMSDQALTRDRPIVKGRAALLIIDVQNGVIGPAQATSKPEFHAAASARVIPNIRRLLDAFRAAHLEVIYTMIENLTEDGRDCSLDYKLSSFNIAKGSWEAHIIDEIAPQSEQEARSRWTLTGLLSAWEADTGDDQERRSQPPASIQPAIGSGVPRGVGFGRRCGAWRRPR